MHKGQGLQLPKVAVHADYEFTGGLFYVALSRVKKPSDVQILNFKLDMVKNRDKEIAEIESLQFEEQYDPNCNYCRRDVVYPDLFNNNDLVGQMEVVDNIEYEDDPETNDSIQQEFEGGRERNMPENEEEQKLHLEMVLEGMETAEDELDLPPNTFDYHQFLTELNDQSCMMHFEYSVKKNGVIDIAINSMEKSTIFINI